MNDKVKVLYVDDEEVNVFLFKTNFGKYYDIYATTDPTQAPNI